METILKIRDICKGHHSCYDNCPFHVDNECVLGIPPANWSDEDLYLIGKAVEQEPTTKDVLALLEKTYADFCSCEGGEGWLKIDGKEYSTDAGYAIEGVNIFMEIFKLRLAESEDKEFHCGIEESDGHAYNCSDCPNKCSVYYQWDKEIKNDT